MSWQVSSYQEHLPQGLMGAQAAVGLNVCWLVFGGSFRMEQRRTDVSLCVLCTVTASWSQWSHSNLPFWRGGGCSASRSCGWFHIGVDSSWTTVWVLLVNSFDLNQKENQTYHVSLKIWNDLKRSQHCSAAQSMCKTKATATFTCVRLLLLLLGLGEADGLWGTEPVWCWGLWGVVVVVVVFMEWNETARRQTWTTEPVFCPVIMGNWTNIHKWCEKGWNAKQHVNVEKNEQR